MAGKVFYRVRSLFGLNRASTCEDLTTCTYKSYVHYGDEKCQLRSINASEENLPDRGDDVRFSQRGSRDDQENQLMGHSQDFRHATTSYAGINTVRRRNRSQGPDPSQRISLDERRLLQNHLGLRLSVFKDDIDFETGSGSQQALLSLMKNDSIQDRSFEITRERHRKISERRLNSPTRLADEQNKLNHSLDSIDEYRCDTSFDRESSEQNRDGTDHIYVNIEMSRRARNHSRESIEDNRRATSPSREHLNESRRGTSPSGESLNESRRGTSPSGKSLIESRRDISPSGESLNENRRGISPSCESLNESRRGTSPSRKSLDKSRRGTSPSRESINQIKCAVYENVELSRRDTSTSRGSLNECRREASHIYENVVLSRPGTSQSRESIKTSRDGSSHGDEGMDYNNECGATGYTENNDESSLRVTKSRVTFDELSVARAGRSLKPKLDSILDKSWEVRKRRKVILQMKQKRMKRISRNFEE